MTKVLFIRGFNTDLKLGNKTYITFDNYFILSEYELTYFNYSVDENIKDVYLNLIRVINNNNFDIIIGHSLGGALLMKFCHEFKNIKNYKKIIFLMPLVHKINLLNIISNIPLISYLYLPKVLFMPNIFLCEDENILDDTFSLTPLKQIIQSYQDILISDENIINTLKANENCILFYATDERFSVIDKATLKKIDNIIYVNGRHECFNESKNSNKFFKELANQIQNNVI